MPNLSQLLTTKAKPEHLRLFNACKDLHSQLTDIDNIYVCGGYVRDLIMGNQTEDIDLCIEGNSKKFSTMLSERLNLGKPHESQFLTFKFVGGKGKDNVKSIDIVTCRDETYPTPASLPDVIPSSIDKDLNRRDFTVNAMAISLTDQHWGDLIDPSNGFGDIMRKRIRVLHDASFIDDPTRVFRAVRYATRLGFNIDTHTTELITNAIGNVDLLSGTRVRHEFEHILKEPKVCEMLRKAEDLGLLGAITPALRVGPKALEITSDLLKESSGDLQLEDLLARVTFGLNTDEAKLTSSRFDGPKSWTDSISGNAKLASVVGILDNPTITRSEIADVLDDIPLQCIRAYIATGSTLPRRGRLIDYLQTIRFEGPEITGEDLMAAGVPEGPTIGQLLELVKRARLDRKVNSKKEEMDLARSRLPEFLTHDEDA